MASSNITPALQLTSVSPCGHGKVRDLYQVDERQLLIVTSDRISAFDVVLPDTIPGKGKILTALSRFWFQRLAAIVPNHLSDTPLQEVLTDREIQQLDGRAMLVQKLQPLPFEAVVRGYLIGSGWQDYQNTGAVSGIVLPPGLQLAQALAEPLFTPATKAAVGEHDENIDFATMAAQLGTELATQIKTVSLELYRQAAAYARQRGIIIADTKFEFALNAEQQLVLIDEVLTPDSSRFWPANLYQAGHNPPSYDKQFVRDYLQGLDWNKQAPGPSLPTDIITKTAAKYQEVLHLLTAELS